jgi:hypothetical protein
MSATVRTFARSSGSSPSFFSSTSERRAAVSASAWCSGVFETASARASSTYGFSRSPARILARSTRETARSSAAWETRPARTSSGRRPNAWMSGSSTSTPDSMAWTAASSRSTATA